MELDRRTCIGTICSFLAYLLNPFRRRKAAEEFPVRALVKRPSQPKVVFDTAFYRGLGVEMLWNSRCAAVERSRRFCAPFFEQLSRALASGDDRPLTHLIYCAMCGLLEARGLGVTRGPWVGLVSADMRSKVKTLDIDELRMHTSLPLLEMHMVKLAEELAEQYFVGHPEIASTPGKMLIIGNGVAVSRQAYMLVLSAGITVAKQGNPLTI